LRLLSTRKKIIDKRKRTATQPQGYQSGFFKETEPELTEVIYMCIYTYIQIYFKDCLIKTAKCKI
jgi:hypothetical protein